MGRTLLPVVPPKFRECFSALCRCGMTASSDTAFLITAENPLKSTGNRLYRKFFPMINLSVRFTAQRPPSRLPSPELTPAAPSLCFRKNVLLLVNAFIVFSFRYDTTLNLDLQEKYFCFVERDEKKQVSKDKMSCSLFLYHSS